MHSILLRDWFSASYKKTEKSELISMLKLPSKDFVKMKHGRNGYRQGIHFNGISIYFDGTPEMGICLDMSGTGCRAFETFGAGDWQHLHKYTKEHGNLTRLDIAHDNYIGLLPLDRMLKDVRQGNLISKFRSGKVDEGLLDSRGVTINFGSPQSEIKFRIYDKAAERNKDGYWVRFEMQLRRERAQAMSELIMTNPENISQAFLGVVHQYLRFIVPNPTETNISRLKTAPYWKRFIADVEKIRLFTSPGFEYNKDHLHSFVYNQAAGAAMTAMLIDGEEQFIQNLLKAGDNLNPKYQSLLDLHGTA